MHLAPLKSLSEKTAPYSTIYLEARSPAEDADHQVRLRWDDLRRRLADQGSPEAALDAMQQALLGDGEDLTEVQTDGRVLVADAETVLLDEAWDAALGAGDAAHVSPVPELGAYVRERATSARLLVVVVDQEQATVRRTLVSEGLHADAEAEVDVEGPGRGSVHKPREGAYSHLEIQRRADEVVKQNARGIAERVDRLARRWKPDAVVLAGGIQGRTALSDELPTALAEITHIAEHGGTDDAGAEEALEQDLREIVAGISAEDAQDWTGKFEEAKARNHVAEGVDAVRLAAEMGAVDTLLLTRDGVVDGEGAVLAACARIDADAAVAEKELPGGIAAILRFEAPDEVARA